MGGFSGTLGAGLGPAFDQFRQGGQYDMGTNPVAEQTQQMAKNPFGAATGGSAFQPMGRTSPQMQNFNAGQQQQLAPTPDDLYADFQQRTGQADVQPQMQPQAGGMGGKSGGFGPAQPMAQPAMQRPTPTIYGGPANKMGPQTSILGASTGPAFMQNRPQPAVNPAFQGGLRPAPTNYRAPMNVQRPGQQFLGSSTGPLVMANRLR